MGQLQNFLTCRPEPSSSAQYFTALNIMTKSNVIATEPQIEVITPRTTAEYLQNAERVNGWLAMIGFNAAVGAYIFTGQILPGVF